MRARLVDALLAGVIAARERIDLRAHAGAHPRIGAADVLPIVPIDPGDLDRARGAALALGARIGALGLPAFLYAPPGRGPAFYRRGGPEELQRRLDEGEAQTGFRATARLGPSAGAVILGARPPLVALSTSTSTGHSPSGQGDRRRRPGERRRLPRRARARARGCRPRAASRSR